MSILQARQRWLLTLPLFIFSDVAFAAHWSDAYNTVEKILNPNICAARLDPRESLVLVNGPGFQRPIEINFMCTYGQTCSVLYKDAFRDFLRGQGVARGVNFSTQGASQWDAVDNRFKLTDTVRKIWNKNYIIVVTALGQGVYREAAEKLLSRAGLQEVLIAFRQEGDLRMLKIIEAAADEMPLHVPVVVDLYNVNLKNRGVSSPELHQFLWQLIRNDQRAKANPYSEPQ